MTTNGKPRPTARSEQRRQELRRNIPRDAASLRQILLRPDFIRATLIILIFLVCASMLVIWSRERVLVHAGRIVKHSHHARLDYGVENTVATETARAEARAASPFVYVPNTPVLDRLHSSLLGLPTAVAGTDSVSGVADALKQDFDLTDASLRAVKPFAGPGGPTDSWTAWTDELVHQVLIHAPILDGETFQLFSTQAATNRALETADDHLERPLRGEPLNVDTLSERPLPQRLLEIVRRAGYPESVVGVVAYRIAREDKPTLLLDHERTEALRDAAADAVEPSMIEHAKGEAIYTRGERLTTRQFEEALREASMHAQSGTWGDRWLPRIGMAILLAGLSVFLGAFTTMNYRRIARNALRLVAICLLMVLMLAVSVLVSADATALMLAAAVGPLLLSTTILRLAYDQRMALALATIQAAITTIALQETIGWFVLLMAGAATLVAQLDEVRSRACLIRASSMTAGVIGGGAIVLGMIELPGFGGAFAQALIDAVQGAAAALCVGFLVLGILPSIEKMFHITTGMTLAELRDPRRPLLRELQQRAPGTYDHSLQVASIAEAAAEAIGADGLLVYVGALYHDIGKMHKPNYFVENQVSGENRHEGLSPAMSLLVIIGHVKDGMELAREFGLPRAVTHFIESHHGTTLVEYFYHAARQRAEEAGDGEIPEDVDYRYPGPRPRTREAAILMLADCAESATRAMSEPKPAQIEGLVEDLARKRLLDGQFDDTPMTLTELGKIQDAIVARLCAIHHGRITYPDADDVEA